MPGGQGNPIDIDPALRDKQRNKAFGRGEIGHCVFDAVLFQSKIGSLTEQFAAFVEPGGWELGGTSVFEVDDAEGRFNVEGTGRSVGAEPPPIV